MKHIAEGTGDNPNPEGENKKVAKKLKGAEAVGGGDKAYVDMPFPGSHEETIDRLRSALGAEQIGTNAYTSVLATHPDKVVYARRSYTDNTVSHFERPYKMDGTGVKLGEAKEVVPGMLKKSAAASSKELGGSGESTSDAISRMASSLATSDKPIMFFKDKAGAERFFLVGSNNFEDREDETFTAAAHKDYVQWCDTQGSYPELWLWHAKGSRFGQVDWLDFVEGGRGGMVVASGTIDDTKAARDLVSRIKEYDGAGGVSHGYVGVRNKEGHWTKYRTWEYSWLPASAAANIGTAFNLLEGAKEVGFTPTKYAALLDIVGDEATVKGWEQETDAMNKGLQALGIQTKELQDQALKAAEKAAAAADTDDDADDEPDDDSDDQPKGKGKASGSKEMEQMTAGFKAMSDQLSTLVTATKDLTEATAAAMDASNKALKKADKALKLQSTSLDEAVAAAMNPRNAAGMLAGLKSVKAGTKAAGDPGTMTDAEANALTQPMDAMAVAFKNTILGQINSAHLGIKGLDDTSAVNMDDPIAAELAMARNGNGNGQH